MWPGTHQRTPRPRTRTFGSALRGCFPRGLAFSQVPRPISPRGRVYPRECGAATVPPQQRMQWGGLSPRVRGSRSSGGRRRHPTGSIPASTGQPLNDAEYSGVDRVYPREYGAATTDRVSGRSRPGLSPRVRGSRPKPIPVDEGSIPASTGQPLRGLSPRVRGSQTYRGLSPRVRGSRAWLSALQLWPWSIPASTGQPFDADVAGVIAEVYPREYGAAACSSPSHTGV